MESKKSDIISKAHAGDYAGSKEGAEHIMTEAEKQKILHGHTVAQVGPAGPPNNEDGTANGEEPKKPRKVEIIEREDIPIIESLDEFFTIFRAGDHPGKDKVLRLETADYAARLWGESRVVMPGAGSGQDGGGTAVSNVMNNSMMNTNSLGFTNTTRNGLQNLNTGNFSNIATGKGNFSNDLTQWQADLLRFSDSHYQEPSHNCLADWEMISSVELASGGDPARKIGVNDAKKAQGQERLAMVLLETPGMGGSGSGVGVGGVGVGGPTPAAQPSNSITQTQNKSLSQFSLPQELTYRSSFLPGITRVRKALEFTLAKLHQHFHSKENRVKKNRKLLKEKIAEARGFLSAEAMKQDGLQKKLDTLEAQLRQAAK